MTDVVATNETILVVGGGVSGMTTRLCRRSYYPVVQVLSKTLLPYLWSGNKPAPHKDEP